MKYKKGDMVVIKNLGSHCWGKSRKPIINKVYKVYVEYNGILFFNETCDDLICHDFNVMPYNNMILCHKGG